MGKLTLQTTFFDDPKKSLVEQQSIRLENILASRAKLDQDYNILGEAVLLDCAELNTSINRLLFPEKAKTEPAVSIKVNWDLVHVSFKISFFIFLNYYFLIVSISKR